MNDLRVYERLTRAHVGRTLAATRGNVLPRFTGGQVVAGSNPVSPTSPTRKSSLDLLFSVAETAIMVQLLFVWDHVFGCEAFFGRTCPMVK